MLDLRFAGITRVGDDIEQGMSSMKRLYLKIRRQDSPQSESHWEHFHLPFRVGQTVAALLSEIQMRPVNARGEAVPPVVWESNCQEGACGSCSMTINGKPSLACLACVEDLQGPMTLEPTAGFPVLRDLVVDRSRFFDAYRRVRDWVESGKGSEDFSPDLSRMFPHPSVEGLGGCIDCGLCVSVCPQSRPGLPFIGPAALARALHKNLLPGDGAGKEERLLELMRRGGLEDCGHAQNCQQACPVGVPLLNAIALLNRKVTRKIVSL